MSTPVTISDTPGSATPGAGGPATAPALSKLTAGLLLFGVFFAVLMGAMDALVVSTVLPTIATDLHQVNGVTFVVSGYLISSTIAIPIFARLSDISSRRNVFLVGLVIFIGGSALAGFSQNLTELIVFRSVQGFGGGGIFPVAIAMVSAVFPPQVRTRAVAVLAASSGISIVAGPLLGSYIVSVTTWRWVFYINLPFGGVAFAILWLAVGPLRSTVGGRFDFAGAGLMAGWVATLMTALVQVSDAGWAWNDPRIVGLLAAAVALCVAFLVWELRTPQPLVPLGLLRRRVIGSASAIMLFTGVVFSALLTFLSLYVGIVLGYSAGDIRDMIYFFAIPMILGVAVSGAVLNRVPYRWVVAPGLMVAGLVGFALGSLTASTPLWTFAFGFVPSGGIALPLIPMGLGLGTSLAGSAIAVQNDAPVAELGTANGLIRFFQSLGGAIGISLLTVYQTWRFQQLSAGARSPSAVVSALASSYDEVFVVLAAIVLVAFVASLGLTGRTPTSRPVPRTSGLPGADPPP